jgi:hypothetical protein
MQSIDFTNWNSFLYSIHQAENEMGNPTNIWYRGVPKFDYTLIPALYRIPIGRDKERDLFEKYRLIASRVFPERNNDWEILADMQHHGIPTRLLDWTEVLGVAIFFALLGNEDRDSGIYLLDPIKLNTKSKKNRAIQLGIDDSFDYRKLYWEASPVIPQFPIAVEAKFLAERIYAQHGRFTIHGDDTKPLEEQFPDCVKKIRFPQRTYEGAKYFLKIAGLNEFSIFPDITGLAPYLLDIVGMT